MTTEIYPHIADHARSMPDKPALVMSDGLVRLTFAELDARSHELARQIAGYGVGFGGNIAILMGNRPEYAIAAWAAQRSGLHYTPVNWRSEEHTSELQSLMRISYAVFCLKKKTQINTH